MGADAERTEEATPRRRARARAQGISARSALMPVALALAFAVVPGFLFVTVCAHWPAIFRADLQTAVATPAVDLGKLLRLTTQLMSSLNVNRVAWLAFLCSFIAATCSSALCGSLTFTLAVIVPKRNPWAAPFARVASQAHAMQLLATSTCIALVGCAAVKPLRDLLSQFIAPSDLLVQAYCVALAGANIWLRTSMLLLALALVDIVWQRYRQRGKLRMTPRETRDERAETETKPETKQRRKSIGLKRVRGLRIAAIKRATAILTNPTHLAIALRYAPPHIDVPMVVARGAGLAASMIRSVALLHNVPVVEAPELTRHLYAYVDVDEPIPEQCFAAVAAIFAWLVRTRGVLRRGDDAE